MPKRCKRSGNCVIANRFALKQIHEGAYVEGRDPIKGNTSEQNTSRTQCRPDVPSALDRVRMAVMRDKKMRFTALLHHVCLDRLRTAYFSSKKDAAAGVDGITWQHYGQQLEENLQRLHSKVHTGAYRAKPTRRVYIPKPDGRQRPLGIATLEDKIVQRALVEVMNAIYESDFLGFSYGFRPGRGSHDALDALAAGIAGKKVNWVLDADICGFFDAIDHGWLVKFIKHRIADGRVLRLIQKWLRAGVMEQGKRLPTDIGSPQGATVSPLLANICLHYALDLWVQQWRGRHAHGDVIIVRYADDFLVGFQHYSDAQQFSRICAKDSRASGSNCIPRKRASSPSGDTPRSGVRGEVSRARRQPLISLGLRTAADARGTGSLCWCVVRCVPV